VITVGEVSVSERTSRIRGELPLAGTETGQVQGTKYEVDAWTARA
jgi:hypothetical protein